MFKKLSVVLVLCSFLLTGCPEAKKKDQFGTSGSSSGTQSNDDVFRQAMDSLNQLENHYGRETLNQAMSRLDGWIAGMPKDDTWKESPYFVQQEHALLEIHQELSTFQTALKKITGQDGSEATPKDVLDAATIAKSTLEKMVKVYASLGVDRFIEIVEMLNEYHQNLTNFGTVAQQQNLNSARINEFAKNLSIRQMPLDRSIATLDHYLFALEIFTETFRGDSLSMRGLDGDYIKQVIWCRNISHWARGNRQIDLERAKELFDWTVRNITLKSRFSLPDGSVLPATAQPAWQAILYGQGILSDWANVFVELLRQQRIDACVLGVVDHSSGIPRQIPWGVGVLIGNEIYVFFAELGIPLPEHNQLALKEGEGLVISKIATLAQLKADPSLMTISGYGNINGENAKKIVDNTSIFLVVDPLAHSMRMKMIENELQGEDKAVLYSSPGEYRERIQKAAGDTPLAVWHYVFNGAFENSLAQKETDLVISPSQAIQNAAFQISIRIHSHPLWKGRILYFANKTSGEEGAANFLQESRVTELEMSKLSQLDPIQMGIYRFATVTASYWLGTLAYNSYDRDDPATHDSTAARNYFMQQVLQNPLGEFWRNGATYHMARIAEREGKYEEAAQFYRVPTQEVDQPGRFLRASILTKLANLTPPANARALDPASQAD